MLFSVILLSLVINLALDGQQLDIDTILPRPLLLSCSGSIHPTLVLAALCYVVTANSFS